MDGWINLLEFCKLVAQDYSIKTEKPVYLSVFPSVPLSVRLFVRLSICPSIHVSRPRSRSRDSGDENDNIQERHFRPHFLQAPGDLIVQEGRLCRMDCKVQTQGVIDCSKALWNLWIFCPF